MDLLAKLIQEADRSSQRHFVDRHLGVYLLCRIPDVASLAFATRVGSPSSQDLISAIRGGGKSRSDGRHLFRVEKSDRNTWRSRISVGRAQNNDIVLRHDSVSKLHAHFLVWVGERGGQQVEELLLCDVGSANGTGINGNALPEGEDNARPVSVGDRILFGEVECDLLDAAALHGKLRSVARDRDF